MKPVVGIDLGTSNSAVAAVIEGKPQVISDTQGHRLTPSVVAFGKDKKILVGSDARQQLFSNPARTITSIKRLIGRKIFSPEAQKAKALLPYQIVEGAEQNAAIQIDDQIYLPQEISALILKQMKLIADTALKENIEEAVVTVPAYFNDNQRQATKDACRIAGLEPLRIINEPTAAALAYGFGKSKNERIAIYDLGGGTFDISILQLRGSVFEVLSTAGDTYLGGDDFDDRIIDVIAEAFLKKHGFDLRTSTSALSLLRINAEKAKQRLSYAEKTDIYIPGIAQQNGTPIDLHHTLSRAAFEEFTKDLIQRTFAVCDEALRGAQLKPSELSAVILVGGSTKMSVVYDSVGLYFGKPPLRDLNPDEVVATGASIQASALKSEAKQKSALLLDVTPLDLGIETVGGYVEPILEANTPIPTQQTRAFTTVKDFQETVTIRIFQGKDRRVESSNLLGEFEFSGFEKDKAGLVSIDVAFAINTDGIVEVTARDKKTNVAQKLKVKLSAQLNDEKLRESFSRAKDHQIVALKPKANLTKVVVCIPSRGGPVFEEGLVENFDPLMPTFKLLKHDYSQRVIELKRDQALWVMQIDDFANIPRYLQALNQRPQNLATSQALLELRLKDGEVIFGAESTAEPKSDGFWLNLFHPEEELSSQVFIYEAQVAEKKSLKAA